MATRNQTWNLEAFLDSLIVELDKARETLAIKAINKPLTYAVKDVGLEMQLFPSFDGKEVRFITAEPGQSGASKISIQLGSITDQQIRSTTKQPLSKDDIDIEVIDEIDDDTKRSLRKIGVKSVTDLEEIEKKNVNIEKISDQKLNYKQLAGLLNKARRNSLPPSVRQVSLSLDKGEPLLTVHGENLAVDKQFEPVAVWNGRLANIVSAGHSKIDIQFDPSLLQSNDNELIITLDPFAIFKIKINNPAA